MPAMFILFAGMARSYLRRRVNLRQSAPIRYPRPIRNSYRELNNEISF